MKKKIKKPKGLFSMNDVYNEEHKYDCREIAFGGWDAATIKSRNQGFGWTLFTLPNPQSNVNQPIPIDYKKPYRPTIVNYKNTNLSESSSFYDDDSFANAVLMTCPKINFASYPKRATSVATERSSSNRFNSLPNNCLYDFSTNYTNVNYNTNVKKRPKTEKIRKRKNSPTEFFSLSPLSKSLNSNFVKSKPNQNEIKSQTSNKDELNQKSKCNVCTINQMVKMPPKRMVYQGLRGDDPNHFPFRMSVSVLNEFAKEQQEMQQKKVKKKKAKSTVSKKRPTTPSSFSLSPRNESAVV